MSYLFSDEWGTYLGLDRILVPLEGFPAELEPLHIALYIAECSKSVVSLLHIREDYRRDEVFDRLSKMAEEKAGEMGVELRVDIFEGGDPADIIVERAEEVDLMVMGGKRRVREELFGSVSSRVIRRAKIPILVATSPIESLREEVKPIKRILTPLRSIEEDVAAVKLAANLTSSASVKDFELLALHVFTLPSTAPISAWDDESMRDEERRFLRDVGELTKKIARPIIPYVIVGRDVGRSIVDFAEKHRVDLIILGEREKPGPFTRLLGTHSLYISRNAPCGVVLIYRPSETHSS